MPRIDKLYLRALGILTAFAFAGNCKQADSRAPGDVIDGGRLGANDAESVETGAEFCEPSSPSGFRGCVDPERYRADLEFVAQPRVPGSGHWQEVQDLCANRLEQLGYDVERQAYGTGVNVIGRRAGLGSEPVVLVSAHYDHIADCPGADDNATGVAATLEVARVLALGRFTGTLVVACWDEEERGHLGSKAYVSRLKAEGKPSVVMNYEMIGFSNPAEASQSLPEGFETYYPEPAAQVRARQMRADFIGLVFDNSAASWAAPIASNAMSESLPLVKIEVPAALKSSSLAADLRRSDHATFWDANIPAIMLTDTGDLRDSHYHCKGGPDAVADLDLGFATKVTRATVGAAAAMLVLQ